MSTIEISNNLADKLTLQAMLRPEAPAIHLPNRIVTFRQLDNLVWKIAAHLHGNGIRSGVVVALTFANELGIIATMLATARIGATAFSIPIGTPLAMQKEMASSARVQFLATDILDLGSIEVPHIVVDLDRIASDTSIVDPTIRDQHPQAAWLIITGSGSTGRAKQIPVSHVAFLERINLYSENIPTLPSDRVVSLIYAHFSAAKMVYLRSLFAGASICLFDKSLTDPIEVCRQENVSVLYLAVIHLEQLVNRLPGTTRNALGSLRALVPLGSAVSDTLRRQAVGILSSNLCIRYGVNEIGPATHATPQDVLSTPGTVGRPLSGVQVEVVTDDGEPVKTGDTGRIRIKSPGMIDQYLDDEIATKHAFRDGWFLPGDLGKLTPDGQLVLLGRDDQLMIMDGINVYPAEIEAVVARHPAVRDSAAIPVHSAMHQNIPVCAVALHPGQRVTEKELLEFAIQRLGFRHPRRIIILEKLPRSEQGKLLLQQLNQIMVEKLSAPA